jgi:lipoate-protein ligase A
MCGLEKMGLKPRLAGSPPEDYVKGSLPCFSYPARDEIEVLGRKVVGSAQKRIGRRFLQHGSIPLETQQQRLRRISRMQEGEESVRMIPLSEALKRKVDFDWVTKHLAEGLAEFFSVSLVPLTLSRRQNESIARIQKIRYGIPASIFGAAGPVDFSPHR